jgi:hypothetical protein
MNLYVKLGLISFLAGTLGASITPLDLIDLAKFLSGTLDYPFRPLLYFFSIDFPLRCMIFGGIPGLGVSFGVLRIIRVFFNKSGKSQKHIYLTSFITSLLFGIFIGSWFVALTGGM